MERDIQEIKKDIIKLFSKFQIVYQEAPVVEKTGREAMLSIVWERPSEELILAKHYYDIEKEDAVSLFKELYFDNLKLAFNDRKKLNGLKKSFWERIKFLFINN